MSPEEAMQLLDRLFQRFDTLATAHGIYKARACAGRRSQSHAGSAMF
jgi:hypothetical protein